MTGLSIPASESHRAQPMHSHAQSGLLIGQRGAPHEREANEVADRVMKMYAPEASLQSIAGNDTYISTVAAPVADSVQMSSMESEEDFVQMAPEGQSWISGSGNDEEETPIQQKTKPNKDADLMASDVLSQQIRQSKGGGASLDSEVAADLGQKMGADFSQVKVHTGAEAVQMSSDLGARAFTHGQHIYFNQGQYNPNSHAGKHLLAHELTHTVQQSGQQKIIQRQDLEADFAGAPSEREPVSGEAWPPGMVRVTYPDQHQVLVPYHTYNVQEIPPDYYPLTMRIANTKMGYAIYHNVSMDEIDAEIIEVLAEGPVGAENKYHEPIISVGQLCTWATRNNLEVRVMIGQISGQFHLFGFDSFQYGNHVVSDNYVESTPGVSGVGRVLIVQQFLDAIANGNIFMAEVGEPPETVLFNNALVRVAGYHKSVVSKEPYRLTLRQMINVLIAWNAGQLTSVQIAQLTEIVSRDTEPTFDEVQIVLANRVDDIPAWQRNGPDDPGPGGGQAGVLARVVTAIRQVFRRMLNPRSVMALGSFRELQNPYVLEQIKNVYSGLVVIEGILYQISQNQGRIQTREITAEPLSLSFPGLQLTAQGTLMLSSPQVQAQLQRTSSEARRGGGGTSLAIQGLVLPNGLRVGELIVVGGQVESVVRDMRTGRIISAYFSGGNWYQITTPRGTNMTIDAATGRIIPPEFRVINGYPVPMTPAFFEPASRARTNMGRFSSPMARAAVGGLGLIAVANDILAPMGAALRMREDAIKKGHAENAFWMRHGADPVMALWDAEENKEVDWSLGTSADAFDFRYPYIKDINIVGLRAKLKDRILSFQEYMLFLETGTSIGALARSGDAYHAVVNRAAFPDVKLYDLTAALEETDQHITAKIEEGLVEIAASLPDAERLKLCRLARGNMTPMFRDVNGMQPVFNASETLGDNPKVMVEGEVNTTSFFEWFFFGQSESRVMVRAANADAMKAALYAKYHIGLSIEDAKTEIERSDRPVVAANEQYGRLISFTAGPGGAGRFGTTNYMRNPSNQAYGTIANGELFHFWVNKSDLITLPILQLRFYLQSTTVLHHDVVQELLFAMSPLEKQVFREDPYYAQALMRRFRLSKERLRGMIGHLVDEETLEQFYQSECPNCHRDYVQWHEPMPIFDLYDLEAPTPGEPRSLLDTPGALEMGNGGHSPEDIEKLIQWIQMDASQPWDVDMDQ